MNPNAAQEAADRIKARRAEDGSLHGSGRARADKFWADFMDARDALGESA